MAERTAQLTKRREVKKKRSKVSQELDLTESDKKTSAIFVRFQELPTDVRLKIWNLALPGPRLVEICSRPHPRGSSHRSMPSILHVCSESREEALKSYTAFPLGLASNCLRAVYVNFQIDTLYFIADGNYGWMPSWQYNRHWAGYWWPGYGRNFEQLMNNVRFVAMRHEPLGATSRTGRVAMPFLQRFGKLEELTVVMIDVGIGEITGEIELDKWQIGEITDKPEWNIFPALLAIIKLQGRILELQGGHMYRPLVESIKRDVVTRDSLGLKNIKVRIVKVVRGVKASLNAGPAFPLKGRDLT